MAAPWCVGVVTFGSDCVPGDGLPTWARTTTEDLARTGMLHGRREALLVAQLDGKSLLHNWSGADFGQGYRRQRYGHGHTAL